MVVSNKEICSFTQKLLLSMKQLLLVSVLLMCGLAIHSQSVSDITSQFIANSLAGKTSSDQIKKLDACSFEKILESCSQKLADSLVNVRSAAFDLVYIMSMRKIDDPQISRVVNLFLNACSDKDAGIVYACLKYLKYFKSTNFDAEARIKLAQMARQASVPHYDLLIRITGLAGITDLMYDYADMIRQKKYADNKIRWALHIALARFGDQQEVDYCVSKAKQAKISDDVIYDLLPDLAYIRSKDTFDFMLDIIMSDEKNCSSSNPDSDAKILCAYRVIKLVAPYINDFPVKIDKAGNPATKNYDQMLNTVRQWINTNRTTYTLNTELY
jgi:hypothetical protein